FRLQAGRRGVMVRMGNHSSASRISVAGRPNADRSSWRWVIPHRDELRGHPPNPHDRFVFMKPYLELGLDTFGDVTLGADGRPLPQAQVIRNLIDEAVLADELGVDFIGVGEHHRADFAVSSPEVVLAAIAGRTSRIRLGSAVTVLSSDDPVRVFQRFATLDAASN